LLDRLEQEEFDLVGIGHGLLADPAWANKVHDGRMEEIKTFTLEALLSLV
jgi:2,4-dienoyl-CoA reductase-like NADH-dependent reductase (Old Yellow Enzyme family)